MEFTIRTASGTQTTQVDRAGGRVRFVIGTPDAHALAWSVFAEAKERDLYLTVRTRAQKSKWSFHDSGDWRLQHVDLHVAATGAERIVDQWSRPSPDENGVVPVVTINTPTSALTLSEAVKKTPVWVSACDASEIIYVHIAILTRPDVVLPAASEERIIGAIPLADQTLAVVVAGTRHPTTNEIEQIRSAAFEAAAAQPGLDPNTDRIALHGHTDTGHRFVWDIPADPTLVGWFSDPPE
jgi:hypothetical protein